MVMPLQVQGILIEIDFATPRSFQGNVTIYVVGLRLSHCAPFGASGSGLSIFLRSTGGTAQVFYKSCNYQRYPNRKRDDARIVARIDDKRRKGLHIPTPIKGTRGSL